MPTGETTVTFGACGRPPRRRRTSAAAPALRASLPLKMTSSIFSPRRLLALCSPRTQVMASATLLLPQPLGPTIAVTPRSKASSARSEKDLKPEISRRSRRILSPVLPTEDTRRPRPDRVWEPGIVRLYGRLTARLLRAGRRADPQPFKTVGSLTRPSPSGKTQVTPQHFGLGAQMAGVVRRRKKRVLSERRGWSNAVVAGRAVSVPPETGRARTAAAGRASSSP